MRVRPVSDRGTSSTADSTLWPPLLVPFLNLLATLQVVWFYLVRVSCYVDLAAYEKGQAAMPFQGRLLWMLPLRWAHSSQAVGRLAAWLTAQHAWFPRGVRPEGIVEAPIDLLAVATAGLVARQFYRRASRTGLLTPFVYPLSLLMIVSTYALLNYHAYRFTADLPGMALFSLALLLLYVRAPWGWFVVVFIVGTLNRETTLLLLPFAALTACAEDIAPAWSRALTKATLARILPLLAFWIGWRLWLHYAFRGNAVLSQHLVGLNLGILATPLAWPQVFGAFGYLLPLILLYRSYIHDATLRTWLWALPAWSAVMLYYGVVVEIRIFGELIPYLACLAALIAEERIVLFLDLSPERGKTHAPRGKDCRLMEPLRAPASEQQRRRRD